MAITEDDLAKARSTASYRAAVWLGRLYLVLGVGWIWLVFGVRPIRGVVVFGYWLVIAMVIGVAQILLSRSGIPVWPRLRYRRKYRWVEWAFYRDVLRPRRR